MAVNRLSLKTLFIAFLCSACCLVPILFVLVTDSSSSIIIFLFREGAGWLEPPRSDDDDTPHSELAAARTKNKAFGHLKVPTGSGVPVFSPGPEVAARWTPPTLDQSFTETATETAQEAATSGGNPSLAATTGPTTLKPTSQPAKATEAGTPSLAATTGPTTLKPTSQPAKATESASSPAPDGAKEEEKEEVTSNTMIVTRTSTNTFLDIGMEPKMQTVESALSTESSLVQVRKAFEERCGAVLAAKEGVVFPSQSVKAGSEKWRGDQVSLTDLMGIKPVMGKKEKTQTATNAGVPAPGADFRAVVWQPDPATGLGNALQGLTTAFLYALFSGRELFIGHTTLTETLCTAFQCTSTLLLTEGNQISALTLLGLDNKTITWAHLKDKRKPMVPFASSLNIVKAHDYHWWVLPCTACNLPEPVNLSPCLSPLLSAWLHGYLHGMLVAA